MAADHAINFMQLWRELKTEGWLCEMRKSLWISEEVAVGEMSGKMRHLGFLLRFRMNCWGGKGLLECEMR